MSDKSEKIRDVFRQIEKYRENYKDKSLNIVKKVYLKPNKPNKKASF